jgi:hypothetical protein
MDERDLERRRARLEQDDKAVALKSPQCRRVLFRVLEQSGVFYDVWSPHALATAYRNGRQSVGRFLWAAIDDVDDQALSQLRSEARARAKQDAVILESARTLSAEEST